jgi:hypothetical protein
MDQGYSGERCGPWASCFQILYTLLILAGDVETNLGPCHTKQFTLDIFQLTLYRNKLDMLLSRVSDFDILCFAETHLDTTILNEDIQNDRFSRIFRKDRNSFGGLVIQFKYIL